MKTRSRLLKNRYYGFRHGQSEANVQGIVLSDPKVGTKRYGLTEFGRRQIIAAVHEHRDVLKKAQVYSSDFLRTKQTAEIIVAESDSPKRVHLDERLRERFFGKFEGQPNGSYQLAWRADRKSAESAESGVEPVVHVAERISNLVREVEDKASDCDVVFVAHGDPLQIAETWLRGDDLENHTAHAFAVGEMRLLNPVG